MTPVTDGQTKHNSMSARSTRNVNATKSLCDLKRAPAFFTRSMISVLSSADISAAPQSSLKNVLEDFHDTSRRVPVPKRNRSTRRPRFGKPSVDHRGKPFGSHENVGAQHNSDRAFRRIAD